ncbi:SIR2 family protein [uncultured Christiangramia sp.]|uniref:SIR2 family protein n=1 Tax=uncultured Christiangramia sp. TaxID=503836 RepID=UPI002629FC2C|nr:SIR2 family protein [uncultured Christiangramia sp.]
MNHILDLDQQESELNQLFKKIAEGNSIAFLGAGASVGEKRYLSKEIIDNYELYLGYSLGEPDITKFVDILSADPSFDRNHFDDEVVKMLEKYRISKAHEIFASIPWREIITTNYDLLVEKAFDEIKSTSNHIYDLKLIKKPSDYHYNHSNSEIRYIKLNGCISDKRLYPLAFSSEDFNQLNKFYKMVLNDLKNLSDDISLFSFGYSFSDDFGKKIMEKYDSYNFRERKLIYNIDPFPNEKILPYYTQKRICIIKCTFQEFFDKYQNWLSNQLEHTIRRKKIAFHNSSDQHIKMPNKLAVDLDNVIKQLGNDSREVYINDLDFYKGEEPNYGVIKRNVDVVKRDVYKKVSQEIEQKISLNHDPVLPIFFLKGDFGIGKTTFTLRLINEFSKNSDFDVVSFEILDFIKLKKENLVELFEFCKAKNVILFCDEIEIETSFKALLELRRELSLEQFNDFNLFFLVPIRENIYEKYKQQREIKKSYELDIDGRFTENETSELLDKLKSCGLIEFNDEASKRKIQQKIKTQYGNDSFISLLEIVTDGNHVRNLLKAYQELSNEAQEAFLYTALLHQFKLKMPAGWLKQIISMDWEEFTKNVVKAEGKGILIQESVKSYGNDPDLYFRTKHPVIAKNLVDKIIPNKDKQFRYIENMINRINYSNSNSYLINNLLKTLSRLDYYSKSKIDKLHDLAYNNFSDDPYFLLKFSMNLQSRGSKESTQKAIKHLVYAESLLEHRNHRFIHRRAVLNFELAKTLLKENDKNRTIALLNLNEAKELLQVKQLMDPFSSYSYIDFIRLLIWEIKNLDLSEEDIITQKIKIEELFDLAQNAVTDDITRILNLKSKYAKFLRNDTSDKEYLEYIDGLYEDSALRPYACILKYNHLDEKEKGDTETKFELIDEMQYYLDNNEVVKFLFKYYGRRLYNANYRIKLFDLSRKHSILENEIPLRFYYFNFIAESYSRHFAEGRKMLKQINQKFHGLDPAFHYVWSNSDGEEMIFEGVIKNWYQTDYKCVKVTQLQQHIQLVKGDYSRRKINEKVNVKLHFYLYGIKAEIIESEA